MNVYDIDYEGVCPVRTITISVVAKDMAEASNLFTLAHPGKNITQVKLHSDKVITQFNPVIQVAKGITLAYDDQGQASLKLVAGPRRWVIPFKELAKYGLFDGHAILASVEQANKPVEAKPEPTRESDPRYEYWYEGDKIPDTMPKGVEIQYSSGLWHTTNLGFDHWGTAPRRWPKVKKNRWSCIWPSGQSLGMSKCC